LLHQSSAPAGLQRLLQATFVPSPSGSELKKVAAQCCRDLQPPQQSFAVSA